MALTGRTRGRSVALPSQMRTELRQLRALLVRQYLELLRPPFRAYRETRGEHARMHARLPPLRRCGILRAPRLDRWPYDTMHPRTRWQWAWRWDLPRRRDSLDRLRLRARLRACLRLRRNGRDHRAVRIEDLEHHRASRGALQPIVDDGALHRIVRIRLILLERRAV